MCESVTQKRFCRIRVKYKMLLSSKYKKCINVSLSRAQKSSVENRDRTISALNFYIACLKIKMQKCPCAPAAVALAATKLCSIINNLTL